MPELRLGFSALLRRLSVAAVLSTVALHSAFAQAPPVQTIDAGPAVPLSPYTSALVAGPDQAGVLEGRTWPLQSRLASGHLKQPVQVLPSQWMTQPVALLGTDEASQRWLQSNLASLRQRGAVALVLAAPTPQDFKRMQRAAADLAVAPGPDPWLEAQLLAKGVRVLPVLVDLDGRAVQELPAADGKGRP